MRMYLLIVQVTMLSTDNLFYFPTDCDNEKGFKCGGRHYAQQNIDQFVMYNYSHITKQYLQFASNLLDKSLQVWPSYLCQYVKQDIII